MPTNNQVVYELRYMGNSVMDARCGGEARGNVIGHLVYTVYEQTWKYYSQLSTIFLF